jgi:hypothetical protein
VQERNAAACHAVRRYGSRGDQIAESPSASTSSTAPPARNLSVTSTLPGVRPRLVPSFAYAASTAPADFAW